MKDARAPPSATWYVAALGAAALLAMAAAIELLRANPPAPGALLVFGGLATLTVLLQRYGLIFTFRGQRTILSLDEPAIFLAPLVLPAPALVPLVGVSTLVVQLLARREGTKLAFNVASYSIAAGASAAGFLGATALGAPPILAACAAVVLYTLVSQLLVSGVFAVVERTSMWRIFAERYALLGSVHVGLGLSLGVAAVALWTLSPLALAALLPLAGSALLFVNMNARSERENKARERLARMVDMLACETELDRVVSTVLEACGDVFLAGSAQLELRPREELPESRTWTWSRGFEGGPAPRTPPIEDTILSRSGAPMGRIVVHPSVRAKERYGRVERGILRIVCAQAASAIENAVALRELLRVRSFSDGVVRNIPAGIALLDREGALRDANPFLRQALRLPEGALSIADSPVVLADEALCAKLRAFVEGQEFRDHDLEADQQFYALSGVRLDEASGGGGVILLNDITQRKLAEGLARSEMLTRPLVRRIVLDIVERLAAPQVAISTVGRSLAAEVNGQAIEDFVNAFRAMGLGDLTLERIDGQTYVFTARDLLERRKRSRQPSCFLTLGFTEGAVAKLHAGGSLGTEVRCQSQGHDSCQFLVVPRDPITPPAPVRRGAPRSTSVALEPPSAWAVAPAPPAEP